MGASRYASVVHDDTDRVSAEAVSAGGQRDGRAARFAIFSISIQLPHPRCFGSRCCRRKPPFTTGRIVALGTLEMSWRCAFAAAAYVEESPAIAGDGGITIGTQTEIAIKEPYRKTFAIGRAQDQNRASRLVKGGFSAVVVFSNIWLSVDLLSYETLL